MRRTRTTTSRLAGTRRTLQEQPGRTLVIDIGGTAIKAALLTDLGKPIGRKLRRETPPSGKPGEVTDAVVEISRHYEPFDRVAVGFPGVIVNGIVKQAPNLGPEWQDFKLADVLRARLQKAIRVANDADVQGFGAISGTGVELVVTLGTGVGTALFVDGRLVPNLEIGKDDLKNKALQKVGRKKWNRRLSKFVKKLDNIFHFTRLYIGGGNSPNVDLSLLPANVSLVSNTNGLIGGIALWQYGSEKPVAGPVEIPKEKQRLLKSA